MKTLKNKLIMSVVLTDEEMILIHDLAAKTQTSMSKIIGTLIRNTTQNKLEKNLKKDLSDGFYRGQKIQVRETNSRIVKQNSKSIMAKSSTKNKKRV